MGFLLLLRFLITGLDLILATTAFLLHSRPTGERQDGEPWSAPKTRPIPLSAFSTADAPPTTPATATCRAPEMCHVCAGTGTVLRAPAGFTAVEVAENLSLLQERPCMECGSLAVRKFFCSTSACPTTTFWSISPDCDKCGKKASKAA